MTNQAKISLYGIKNVRTGPDPGNELEIYGSLFARQLVVPDVGEPVEIRRVSLFERDSNNYVSISEGGIYSPPPGVPQQELVIEPGQFLSIGGQLLDQDSFGGDDDLGFREARFPHRTNLSGRLTLLFVEDGQLVDATFDVIVS